MVERKTRINWLNEKCFLIPWGLRKINFRSRMLRLSEPLRFSERPLTVICFLE